MVNNDTREKGHGTFQMRKRVKKCLLRFDQIEVPKEKKQILHLLNQLV